MESIVKHENKIYADRMFDFSENCIMKYMCHHFNLSAADIFKTVVENADKPLVLKPILEHSDKLLVFTVEIVPYDFVSSIPEDLLEHTLIKQLIGFIYNSTISVYNAILSGNIKDEVAEIIIKNSIHLELDDDALSFYPVYIYPPKRKELILNKVKNDLLENIKKLEKDVELQMETDDYDEEDPDSIEYITTKKENIALITDKYNEIETYLNDNKYNKTFAINDQKYTNNLYRENERIGIIFTELTEKEFSDKYNY